MMFYILAWILCTVVTLFLLWLVIRNRKLSSEIGLRTKVQAALEESLEKLKKAQLQMIHQERIKAVGQMASGISHDFGNALMPIVGLSRMLLDNPGELGDNKEDTLASLRTLNAAAKDARQVAARLKEFYRPETETEFQPFDVNDAVQGSVLITQPRWQAEAQAEGRGIVIKTELTKVRSVMGSSLQLREAFTNLIFNAMDAMPRGGMIWIRTRGDHESVVIEVEDQGTGMSEEVKKHCFDAFYSTKGQQGTGMGLSMVQEIITRHSGNISVASQEGRGTTFTIRLPAALHKATQEASLQKQEVTVLAPITVLVVDDHIASQEMLRAYLQKDGHAVTAVNSGSRACELLKTRKYDLVITDRAMPDLNGDMVAIAAKSSSPNTGVIMLTGFGDMMLVKKEYPAGVDTVMTKPVDPDEIRFAIVEIMEKVKK